MLTASIDINDLFDAPSQAGPSQKDKAEPVSPQQSLRPVKDEPLSPSQRRATGRQENEAQASPSKPKKGRLVSNETPLEDFNALIEGEGDVFRKAIQDLGAVVKENVEASFSRSAFPLAIDCLKAMRSTALTYEEVETYNE